MTDFRKVIAEELREKRPNISESSEKTYASTLFSLNKKMNGDLALDFFKKHAEILQFIKEHMKTYYYSSVGILCFLLGTFFGLLIK